MTYFIHFLIGFGLSFVGSLPFGMINMTVAYTAIRKGMQAAIFTAFGAAFVELIQVFVAMKFTWLFAENPRVEHVFQILATFVFFAGGIYFLGFAKSKPALTENDVKSSRRGNFFRGLFISSLNLMVIPYWIFYATLLTANDMLVNDNTHVVVFSVGTMMGTFTLLVLYAFLGSKVFSKSEQIKRWVNKFIGVLLVGFGVWQIYKMMNG